ncbi:DUF2254 domain-containing protein [Pseudooceanicola sp. 216_PA32_1]|uniref:DUF2254 domain-containing protein n=1 Tax=Pseudooceanicola pacificus TaxID=2676438 RepID=A0A844W3D4_9RHOB|nr:DUF2254 domain-containing protein [Pseudooceanicola pacificus]MWB77331.1 DUF2254 domain-containing protein [Pseudooceanicola pacificus]
MVPSLLRRMHEFSRLLHVRVILIALMSMLAVALAKIFGTLIPPGLDGMIGAKAVDQLLQIIANSMLTVTTFSLTVMAAAHRNVMSQWTPRSHQILLEDTTTHTVLATFVGAYLYAVAAIILRYAEVFHGAELVLLFAVTVMVLLLIVIAIVRWISHLELLGSLIETSQRIEDRSAEAWRLRVNWPALGGHVLDPGDVPDGAVIVRSGRTGYVQQIYQDRLQAAAKECDARIYLGIPVGRFVYTGEILAHLSHDDDRLHAAIRDNVLIGSLRNFTQDPHFGLLCLAETAMRALSPGINDPGTAVDQVGRIARVLLSVEKGEESVLEYDRLHVPRLDTEALIMDTLDPIGRDGSDKIEVQIALRRALAALAEHSDPGIASAARVVAERALERAGRALDFEADVERIEAAAQV